MLRITAISTDSSSVLRLAGRLCGPWIEEVRRCWQGHADAGRKVRLNLEEVTYVDAQGRDLLLEMEGRGVSLEGASEFLRLLLSTNPDEEKSQQPKKEKHNGSSVWS